MKDVYAYKFGNNLYINLTNRCCNACKFCLRTHGDTVNGEDNLWLSAEPSAGEVIDAIKAVSFAYDEVVICGYGEPTYKLEELIAVADYAHSIGKKVRLNTNGLGSLINGKDITPLLKGKIDVMSISLNESSAERYNDLCLPEFGLDAYPAILEFAKKSVALGIDTVLSVVDYGGVDIEECKRVALSTGARLRVREYIED